MKLEPKKSRLPFFQALYERAKQQYGGTSALLLRHMEQYNGSTVIDGSPEPASAVRNITYELIESQVSSDLPSPKITPRCWSEARDRNARTVERLCRLLRDELPFEQLNDVDERNTYIYGGSVWLAEWDNTLRRGEEVGGIRLRCLSPRDFFPQPGMTRIEDMDYCFLRFATTREELGRRFGLSPEALARTDADPEIAVPEGEESVTMVLCFYRDEEGEVGEFAWSGEVVLLDCARFYHRKVRLCTRCGLREEVCRCGCTSRREADEAEISLTHDLPLANGGCIPALSPDPAAPERFAATRLPYYAPRCFPIVLRLNTSREGSLLGQSDCEHLRPVQQQLNKIESRILQKLVRAGITPVVPEDAQITMNNSVFGQVIRLRPGESAAQYGTVDTTPDISQDILQAERLYEQGKRLIGITDTYQGNSDDTAISGVAKRIQVAQAAGRLESKRRMKNAAYADLDRLFFSFYLAYADEPRTLSYRDCWGRVHNTAFRRWDFLVRSPDTGEYVYDDDYLFAADRSGVEQQRESMWERNLENLRAGTLGDPASPTTLLRYWQCQERAHFPHAQENVEYFRMRVAELESLPQTPLVPEGKEVLYG